MDGCLNPAPISFGMSFSSSCWLLRLQQIDLRLWVRLWVYTSTFVGAEGGSAPQECWQQQ